MRKSPQSVDQDVALEDELEDLAERPFDELGWLDLGALISPIVLKALVGIVLAVLVLISPARADRLLTVAFGAGLLVVCLPLLWSSVRRERDVLIGVMALVGLVIGVVLLISGARSQSTLAQIVGAAGIALGSRDLAKAARQRSLGATKLAARGAAVLTMSVLTIRFPAELFAIVTILMALDWIVIGAVAVAVSLDRNAPRISSFADTTDLMRAWIEDRPKSADDRRLLYEKVFFEGDRRRKRIARFCSLIGFAAAISALGIIIDSTAVVIGAMLIAPLMTPLMGMATSLAMGWTTRLVHSTIMVVVGMTIAVVVAVLISILAPITIDTAANAQIVSRSTPTLLDLMVALAAGAAGAYGLSRPDVSDALPGVAVAIALLPPLSVAGISYSQGAWESGNGALLLFATNAVAILVMGGVTLVYTGIVPLKQVENDQRRTKTWASALMCAAGLILGGLLLNGAELARNSLERTETEQQVAEWIADHDDHHVDEISLDGEIVTVVVSGPTTNKPTAESLAERLRRARGRSVTVDLHLDVQEHSRVVSTP